MQGPVVGDIIKPLSGSLFGIPSQGSSDLRAQVIAALFGASEQGGLYDPSDLSTLFQDSAGTTPVTADSDPVGKVLDLSGNGNHMIQATAGLRPLYKTNGTLHWLQLDGTDDKILTSGGAIDLGAGTAVSCVYDIPSGTGNLTNSGSTPGLFASTGSDYLGAAVLIPSADNSRPSFLSVGTSATPSAVTGRDIAGTTVATGTPRVTTIQATSGGFDYYENGSGASDTGGPWGANTVSGADIGLTRKSLTAPARAFMFYGGVAVSALSSANRALLESWLAEKGGITL